MLTRDLEFLGYLGYTIREDGAVYRNEGNMLLKPTRQGPQRMFHVRLHKQEGGSSMAPVHRLVAQAFVPNPLGHQYVLHKDEDPRNNHKDNLFWSDKYKALKREQIIKYLKLGYNKTEIRLKAHTSLAYIESIYKEYGAEVNAWRERQGLPALDAYPDYANSTYFR